MNILYILSPFDQTDNHSPNGAVDSWEATLYFSIPFVIVIIALVYTVVRNGGEFWKEDGFPSNFNYSDKNYAKILVAFGCVISYREEKNVMREKLSWIQAYLDKNFGQSEMGVLRMYEHIVSKGINIKRLVAWSNRNLHPSKKVKLLEFVCHLANTDGSINPRESEFIFYLLKRFGTKVEELDQSIQDLLFARDFSRESVVEDKLVYYFQVLGLDSNAGFQEVKNTYRKLVKIYHPDNHRDLNESEKKARAAKFLEIQQAYELISSKMA